MGFPFCHSINKWMRMNQTNRILFVWPCSMNANSWPIESDERIDLKGVFFFFFFSPLAIKHRRAPCEWWKMDDFFFSNELIIQCGDYLTSYFCTLKLFVFHAIAPILWTVFRIEKRKMKFAFRLQYFHKTTIYFTDREVNQFGRLPFS